MIHIRRARIGRTTEMQQLKAITTHEKNMHRRVALWIDFFTLAAI